ncbi:hypothetical protein E2C01_009200 [Portunus trituberculatus]|uniref:Uncharacterized protein n=1 Tax=Portunus trituberculatus TaxID=210409 RepID=A0A5B7D5D2_PORTR|nr:hypothetical protein [Portunus trituberculatus]
MQLTPPSPLSSVSGAAQNRFNLIENGKLCQHNNEHNNTNAKIKNESQDLEQKQTNGKLNGPPTRLGQATQAKLAGPDRHQYGTHEMYASILKTTGIYVTGQEINKAAKSSSPRSQHWDGRREREEPHITQQRGKSCFKIQNFHTQRRYHPKYCRLQYGRKASCTHSMSLQDGTGFGGGGAGRCSSRVVVVVASLTEFLTG